MKQGQRRTRSLTCQKMNVSIEIVEIFEILLYPLDSGGKSKGSHEFIEIHEGEEDEVSPLPKSANWSEWKQVSFTQNSHFTKPLIYYISRLARQARENQTKAKNTAEIILKKISWRVIRSR